MSILIEGLMFTVELLFKLSAFIGFFYIMFHLPQYTPRFRRYRG